MIYFPKTKTHLSRPKSLHRAALAHAGRQLAAASALLVRNRKRHAGRVGQMMIDRRQRRLQLRIAASQRRDPAAVRLAGRCRRNDAAVRMMRMIIVRWIRVVMVMLLRLLMVAAARAWLLGGLVVLVE